ncbi:transglutaminase domain-containing protein [Chryseolinea lacunae]|uniref:Transglutaminase domain-containing protein n=1 Tax=Chryseolinea lacunae TaxID=2801331 RepID=A0ABS1KY60_9BACT|nr:transglutaminase domain-containing protein [Chryseolinea lacunae]MBL0744386.1 transglutaminase domain-containing protein [Chryseolinea lacunae]
MKKLLLAFLLSAAVLSHAQDYPKMARDLQVKYKDEEAAILRSNIEFVLTKDSRVGAKATVNRSEQLLSLRYNVPIQESEVYDGNALIEKFSAESNLKQRAPDAAKVCGSYTSEGLFFDDSKFCTHQLKLKEVGEVWDISSVKKINDAKYLTAVYFQDKFPLIDKKVTFVIPQDMDVELREFNLADFPITKTETTQGGNRVVVYSVKEIPGIESDSYTRGVQYNHPHILVLMKSVGTAAQKTNILASPQDLYKWYSSLTKRLQPNPAAYKATVTQLIQGKTTDEEKIKAIYYWVQDNIRYIAFEDGLAAFKPDEAQNVFEKRYGDCKGMANLTKEMLKTAGYDARLTWIGTKRIMYDHSLPSLAVNNHMICTLILNGKKYFLDATEKYMPFGENAERIQSRPVMIEDGDTFIADKVTASDKNRDADLRVLKASVNGENLEGSYNITLKGESKKNFLYGYHYTKTDNRKDFLADFIASGDKNVKNTDLTLPDLEERSGPLALDCKLQYAGAVSSFNNEYYVDIDPSKTFKHWTIKDTRQSDLDFGEKIHNKTTVELSVPAGYSVSSLPGNVAINDPEFSFNIQYATQGNKIVYTKELSVPEGVIRKASFGRWNAAVKQLAKAYENQIVLKK